MLSWQSCTWCSPGARARAHVITLDARYAIVHVFRTPESASERETCISLAWSRLTPRPPHISGGAGLLPEHKAGGLLAVHCIFVYIYKYMKRTSVAKKNVTHAECGQNVSCVCVCGRAPSTVVVFLLHHRRT